MKVPELKALLAASGELKCGGKSKDDLLVLLGVPPHFGETSLDALTRSHRELKVLLKKQKKQGDVEERGGKRAKAAPEDDPSHYDFAVDCCKAPRFGVEPVGTISHYDGSVSEIWRCQTCRGFLRSRTNRLSSCSTTSECQCG
jgi:hypothetical protein